jgi:hypothetical protein
MLWRPRLLPLAAATVAVAATVNISIAGAADRPAPDEVRGCKTRGDGSRPAEPPAGAISAGPIFIWPTLRQTGSSSSSEWPFVAKAPTLVRARVGVTLAVVAEARNEASLSTSTGRAASVVRFQACRERERSFGYNGTVGKYTGFPFAFYFKAKMMCLPLEIWVDGEAMPRRLVVPVGRDSC